MTVTTSVTTLAVWLSAPFVPLIVSGYVPGEVFHLVLTVSVDVVDAGLGLNDEEVRAGKPLTLRLTEPVNPFSRVIAIAYEVLLPRVTDRLAGVTDSVKSGARGVALASFEFGLSPPAFTPDTT